MSAWNPKLDEALAELMLLYPDDDKIARHFAELHELSTEEVLCRIGVLERAINLNQVEEVVLSPTTIMALGLQKRVPLKFKRQMAEFLGYAMEAVHDITPMKVPASYASPSQESLCLLLGDWHIGAYVNLAINKFNQEIAKQRVRQITRNTIKLSKQFITQNIQELVIMVVGDMVDGAEIFPTQPYQQELMVLDQIRLASQLMWEMFLTFTQHYKKVRVHAVRGNHGRMSKTAPTEANWDLMLYLMLYSMLDVAKLGNLDFAKNLEIYFSTEEFENVKVNGKNIQIRHEAPTQTETAGASSKFSGYHDISPYDIICYGHYHHPGIEWHQDRPAIKNGSLMGPNELSNTIAKVSSPKQYLFSVPADEEKSISFSYPIFLGGKNGKQSGTAEPKDAEED